MDVAPSPDIKVAHYEHIAQVITCGVQGLALGSLVGSMNKVPGVGPGAKPQEALRFNIFDPYSWKRNNSFQE